MQIGDVFRPGATKPYLLWAPDSSRMQVPGPFVNPLATPGTWGAQRPAVGGQRHTEGLRGCQRGGYHATVRH